MSTAVEKYREDIQSGGKLIEFPEIGQKFHIFPVQSIDMAFYTNAQVTNDYDYLWRMIAARAKTEKGLPLFDTLAEKEEVVELMRRKMPRSVTIDVVNRVMDEIQGAFPVTSIEDATKN